MSATSGYTWQPIPLDSITVAVIITFHRMRKSTVAYKNYGQLPKEPELKEMKIYVGEYLCMYVCMCILLHSNYFD